MANEEHLAILAQGVVAWNEWRDGNKGIRPDLAGADLAGAHLTGANLRTAYLTQANLAGAKLRKADFAGAYLYRVDLIQADLTQANLAGADLRGADLTRVILRGAKLPRADLAGAILTGANLVEAKLARANLIEANVTGANLEGADLFAAQLINTKLQRANLTGCAIHGISAWGVRLDDETKQKSLVITAPGEPTVTVDNLEVAQFVYLLLNNQKIRGVIDTITSKAVLILGRFTAERKAVLDALREELRRHDYLPIVFDFDKPADRDLTETVSTLAHMARFVVADVTDAKSIPQELQKIVPQLPSVPVQPLILASEYEYGMFKDFGGYLSVLPPYRYDSTEELLSVLQERVISPAIARAEEIKQRRTAFEDTLLKR